MAAAVETQEARAGDARMGDSQECSPDAMPQDDDAPMKLCSTNLTTVSSQHFASALAQDYPMLDQEGRLPMGKMILVAFPFVGWFASLYNKRSYMKVFYTDDYPQASLGYIAFFSTLAVIVDAFTDPAMANYTDNCRPKRWGRRRPFVAVGGIMTLILFTLGYTPIVPSGAAASIWFGVFHIGTKLADTVLSIPLEAWGAELTPSIRERSTLWFLRDVAVVIGIMFGAIVPAFVSDMGGLNCTDSPGTGCIGYPILAFFFGLLCTCACLLLVKHGQERPNERLPIPRSKYAAWSEDDIVPTLMSTWLNRPFRFLIVSDVTEALGGQVPYVILPYYTRVVLGDECMKPSLMFSALAFINLFTRLLFSPIWVCAARYFGKFNAYLGFNFLLAGAHALFIFIGRDEDGCSQLPLTIAFVAIWGIIFGGNFLLRAIMSDVADYDEFMSGKRREGQYMMTLTFLPKFLEVPAEAIPFLLMAYWGYKRSKDDDNLPVQPEAVVTLLRMCMSVVPAVTIMLGGVVLCFYPTAARSGAAHKALLYAISNKHRKGLPADDPWYPGHVVPAPPPPGLNDDVLAYFWPGEVEAVFKNKGDAVDYSALKRQPLVGIVLGILLCPGAVVLLVVGWDDMNHDLGASVSPIGLIFLGIAMLFLWFNGIRFCAAKEAEKRAIPRAEFVARYGLLCRFTGASDRSTTAEKARTEEKTVEYSTEDTLTQADNLKLVVPATAEVKPTSELQREDTGESVEWFESEDEHRSSAPYASPQLAIARAGREDALKVKLGACPEEDLTAACQDLDSTPRGTWCSSCSFAE